MNIPSTAIESDGRPCARPRSAPYPPPPRNSEALCGPRLPLRALLLGGLALLAAGPAAAQQVDPPTVPQNFSVTPGDAQLTLTWEAPSNWGTWPAAGFEVFWKPTGSPSSFWQFLQLNGLPHELGPTDTSFVFAGSQVDGVATEYIVNNEAFYDFRIRAYAQQPGTSGDLSSHYRESAWETVAYNQPVSPLALQVTEGDQRLDLSWTAPSGTVSAYDRELYLLRTSSPLPGPSYLRTRRRRLGERSARSGTARLPGDHGPD